MTLEEIFNHLSYGEFRQLFVADPSEGGISEGRRLEMISHINLGLTTLHRRFLLSEKRASVYVVNGLRDYVVNADDLLKIERVFDSEGEELVVNDSGLCGSIATTSYNTLRVPAEIKPGALEVAYRADHPQMEQRAAAKDPDRVEIQLPRTHLWALLLFVASRYFNPMESSAQGFHTGNNYAAKFEAECRALENGGYEVRDNAGRTLFQQRGFV